MNTLSDLIPVVMEAPGTQWKVQKGMAGMSAGHARLPRGVDFTPMFKGLPEDLCQCPHWGYLIEGSMSVKYADGSQETIESDSVFYLPPGHTAWTNADTRLVDFSPEEQLRSLVEHLTGKS